jgi:MerR family copper efflux transcriptional regulator
MLIGELATAAGISRDTLRFYEQQGLIRAQRRDNGYRDYPAEALMLVNYIRTAQQLGFTLAEIGDRLPSIWDSADPGAAITEVLAGKLQEIDIRIEALRGLRQALAERIALACPLASVVDQGSAPRR